MHYLLLFVAVGAIAFVATQKFSEWCGLYFEREWAIAHRAHEKESIDPDRDIEALQRSTNICWSMHRNAHFIALVLAALLTTTTYLYFG